MSNKPHCASDKVIKVNMYHDICILKFALYCSLTLHQIHKEPETSDIVMFDYELHIYNELLQTHSPTDSVFSSQPSIIRFSPLIRENDIPWLCRF